MKKALPVLLLLLTMNVMAQKPYAISTDPKNGQVVFSGPVTFGDLEAEPTFTWFKEGQEGYRPRKKPTEYLRAHLKDYQVIVFMGTWCPDSHNLIPKFKKVLDEAGYPVSQLSIIGVDRSKTIKDGAEKKYAITSVPTFILFRNGEERGRITESVHKRIETDLAALIKSDAGK